MKLCPLRSSEIHVSCDEKKCALWCNKQCVFISIDQNFKMLNESLEEIKHKPKKTEE